MASRPLLFDIDLSVAFEGADDDLVGAVGEMRKLWTRAKEVCRSLNYARNTPNVISDHVSPENRAYKYQLVNLSAAGKSVKWPNDSRKDEYYINEQGMYELVFTSQQKEAKEFRYF